MGGSNPDVPREASGNGTARLRAVQFPRRENASWNFFRHGVRRGQLFIRVLVLAPFARAMQELAGHHPSTMERYTHLNTRRTTTRSDRSRYSVRLMRIARPKSGRPLSPPLSARAKHTLE